MTTREIHQIVRRGFDCISSADGPRDGSEPDNVNHPPHYTYGSIEPIDVIEDWGLGFCDGNALKYIARFRHKNGVEDLEKARWYLDRLIRTMERNDAKTNPSA